MQSIIQILGISTVSWPVSDCTSTRSEVSRWPHLGSIRSVPAALPGAPKPQRDSAGASFGHWALPPSLASRLAIMQLSEAGRVDLDAPVQRYLPWWWVTDASASEQITLRHLLHQVSGLSRATGNAHATSGESAADALEKRVGALRSETLTAHV